MGRNRLTIGQFKVKNLPFVDGVFSLTLSETDTVTITRAEVSTGKRGRKPFVYTLERPVDYPAGSYTQTLTPTMTLVEAIATAPAASDGGAHE